MKTVAIAASALMLLVEANEFSAFVCKIKWNFGSRMNERGANRDPKMNSVSSRGSPIKISLTTMCQTPHVIS